MKARKSVIHLRTNREPKEMNKQRDPSGAEMRPCGMKPFYNLKRQNKQPTCRPADNQIQIQRNPQQLLSHFT